jgi:signal transduction histidine kinase
MRPLATEGADAEVVERAVLEAQVDGLYAKLPVALATVVVNVAIVAWVLRPAGWALLAPWVVAQWALSALRLASGFVRRAAGPRAPPRRWGRIFAAGSALSGLAWGAPALFLFARLGVPERLFFATVVAGMVAGAAGSTSSYPPAFVAFAGGALVPLAAGLVRGGSALELAIAFMAGLFGVSVWAVARTGWRTLTEALRLRYRNEALVERLSAAQARLAALNADLEQRVQERSARLLEAERELAQAGLLAGAGSLAAGVAHHVNNPLAVLMGNLGFLERELTEGGGKLGDVAGGGEAIREALVAAARVRDIVRSLDEVTRPGEGQSRLDVREVLEPCLTLALPELRARARLVRQYDEVPAVRCDRATLAHALLALVVNAARTAGEREVAGRELRVRTRTTPGDGEVVIEVQDSGPLLSPDRIEELLAPPRRGRDRPPAPSLAHCRALVGRLGGTLTVWSGAPHGTTYAVTLPVAE